MKKPRILISVKLISLTILLVGAAAVTIVKKGSEQFTKTLIQREELSNMTLAKALETEVVNTLNAANERTQIIGALLLKSANDKNANSGDIDFNFNKDKSLVAIQVYKISGDSYELVAQKVKTEFLKDSKVHPEYISYLRKYLNFPIKSVAQKTIELRNATLPKGLPLVTLGIPLMKDENDRVTYVALADLQLAVLQKPFSEEGTSIKYMVDRSGTLLTHKDEQKALLRTSFRNYPLISKAFEEQAPRKQVNIIDPETNEEFAGAYVKNNDFGITVASQTSMELILEPAVAAENKAIFIALCVIAVALFCVYALSRAITSPIETLAGMIQLVSKGNFDIKARAKVKSNDEVGDLATAFDNMTEGLKERDKVKNLFSKFHGSSVAEDLLKNDIGVGGSNKQVTVFFSDIRGFTAFSEKRTPEEVVDMLNEYFQVMVSIINKNGGVVDKFIGDAIMAVWGAPHTTDRDTHNAVKACLEMRQALVELNKTRESKEQPPIMIGMGLHTGRAISGTIGSSERMEYTVIGDTVNMTSRIESSTKAFGSDLLVSQDVLDKVGEEYKFELAGSAEVKGKSEPLKMYKVRGYKAEDGSYVDITTPFSDYAAEKADKVKIAS